MVWQVRENASNYIENTSNYVENTSNYVDANQDVPDESKMSTKPEIESRSSRGSSSVDLGPTPGSGLVTTDASEASDTESVTKNLSIGRVGEISQIKENYTK